MPCRKELEDANFVHRDENGASPEGGGCGCMPCDHSKLVNDPATNEERRFCNKFQMYVGSNDSCKYYSCEKFKGLISSLSKSIVETNKAKEAAQSKAVQEEAHPQGCSLSFWIIAIIILLFLYFIIFK